MPAPDKELNPAEFAATLARMRERSDAAFENPQPGFDPYLYREVRADAAQGRNPADYKTAMEAQGFEFLPVEALLPWDDGKPKTEGEWRSSRLRLAFTESDLVTMFRGPEDFFLWCEKLKLQKRAAKSRLLIP